MAALDTEVLNKRADARKEEMFAAFLQEPSVVFLISRVPKCDPHDLVLQLLDFAFIAGVESGVAILKQALLDCRNLEKE